MKQLTLVLVLSVVHQHVSAASSSASGVGSAAEESYKTTVSEAEWSGAVPSLRQGSSLRLVSRPALNRWQPSPGMSAHAKVSVLIRPDGTVGVYRVIETNDPSFARNFIEILLKERFQPPVLDGKPVSVRSVQALTMASDR